MNKNVNTVTIDGIEIDLIDDMESYLIDENMITVTIEDKELSIPREMDSLLKWVKENILEEIDLESIGQFYPVTLTTEKKLIVKGQKTNVFYLNLYLLLLQLKQQPIKEVYTSTINLKKEISILLDLDNKEQSLNDFLRMYNEIPNNTESTTVKKKLLFTIEYLRKRTKKL